MGTIIVNNIEDANFITHSGSFHADEIFCTVMFELLFGSVNLFRTRDLNGANEDAIIFDVGKGELDHHQSGGNGIRENGIKYAAFGLVWKKYGRELLKVNGTEHIEEVFNQFDKFFISALDAYDNGQIDIKNNGLLTFNSAIEGLNPVFGSNQNEDEQFLKAVKISKEIFLSQLSLIVSKCKLEPLIEEAIQESQNNIMILKSRIPYENILLDSDSEKANNILYVIRPGKTDKDGYSINTVPLVLNGFDHRQFFPLEWGGKNPEELQSITEIKTLKFCHANRFLCITENSTDAYKVAELSIKLQQKQ